MGETESALEVSLGLSESCARPRWQSIIEWTAALIMAALWFSAGLWKLSDLTATQARMTQALVPHSLSFLAAICFGAAETLTGVLILVPQWRRWGAWLSILLLGAFMAYIGFNYHALTGADCTCFPWLKRAVGPMFFVEDGAMMAVALVAGLFAAASRGLGKAGIALAAVVLLAAGALAMDRARGQGAVGPETITVDGKQFPLREGRVFLFFLNPYCPHCFKAAQTMSAMGWQAKVIGVPTQSPTEAPGFFQGAGWSGVPVSTDLDALKQAFPFTDAPYGVALENGRLLDKVTFFDEPDLGKQLRKIGFIK